MELLKAENEDKNAQISQLQDEVELLKTENNIQIFNWPDDTYNYLAIGNSITIHPLNDYWWNECGMAATTLENDYVHQLTTLLQTKENVHPYAYNFYMWEVQIADRSETLSLLDGMLSNKIDMVTIQLSENAFDLTTFESDYEELIRYVQKRAQNAKIIVIGDFWDMSDKDGMKQEACENCGVTFVSLDYIKGNKKYQCGLGTAVYDKNGNPHTVEHDGVAVHPNDEGMKWIAERVFDEVKK